MYIHVYIIIWSIPEKNGPSLPIFHFSMIPKIFYELLANMHRSKMYYNGVYLKIKIEESRYGS